MRAQRVSVVMPGRHRIKNFVTGSELMDELQNGPQRLDYQAAWELAREEWRSFRARRMTRGQRTSTHDLRDDARRRPPVPLSRLLALGP